MSRFEGHVCDLGDVPKSMLDELIHTLELRTDLWAVNDPRFLTAHPDSCHIVLKFPDSYPHSHEPASYTPLWPEWSQAVNPLIDLAAERYGFEDYATSKIMLSMVRAHGSVPPHADTNPSSVVPHKVHIPLVTAPEVKFLVEGDEYEMAVGRAYELNNLLTHSVENGSDIDRIHLIFEIYSIVRASPVVVR